LPVFLRCSATPAGRLWFNPLHASTTAGQKLSRILNVPRRKPLIGIPADRRTLGPHPFHCVGEKYIAAVADAAEAIPLPIPALGERDVDQLLETLDGILLTGSPSNVEPQRRTGERAGHVARPAS
jgi:hypothetical protein